MACGSSSRRSIFRWRSPAVRQVLRSWQATPSSSSPHHRRLGVAACSRVLVEHTVFADFVSTLHGLTVKLSVGDPTHREHWMGPVIDAAAVARYEDAAAQIKALGSAGNIVEGGQRLDHGDLAHGHFVAPTIARAPYDHPLWTRELFVPFVLVGS